MSTNDHYIYVWKEQGIANSGLPFYIGQGTHKYSHGKSKYMRAYSKHMDNHQRDCLSYAQKRANKLLKLGIPHIVEILYDNMSQEEANIMEIKLIKRLGRKVNNSGILYNLSEGGDINPMNSPLIRAKHLRAVNDPIVRNKHSEHGKKMAEDPNWIKWNSNMVKDKMNDDSYRAKWDSIFHSDSNIEKIREIQSKILGKKIVFKNVEYRSKKELARTLGISSQLLNYRLKNDIPLDLLPNKGNKKGVNY